MKVITSSEMARIEKIAYQEGFSERDFMIQAGEEVASAVYGYIERHHRSKDAVFLCGKGNNAGDGYVAALSLLKMGCSVLVFQLASLETCSSLCQEQYYSFVNNGGVVKECNSSEDFCFPISGVIVDAIFGTGFHGKTSDLFATAINAANQSKLPILAVDIPSGINGETGKIEGEAIKASMTIFLEVPKTGFFLQDAWNNVGMLHQAKFGLPCHLLESANIDFILVDREISRNLLPPMIRNRHKYEAGLVVGLAGSSGMPGAAMLASASALRGGAGMMRLLHPKGIEAELSSSLSEVIKIPYSFEDSLPLLDQLNQADSAFIGPGMGRSCEARRLLKEVIPKVNVPCVIDGDGLTIIAEEKISLPKRAVLTPHKGELLRLLQRHDSPITDKNFLWECQSFTEMNEVTLVLKGSPTFIFNPQEPIAVNATGDPGMATAGSGDVLTGLIAALMAQKVSGPDAARLGAYLHGFAGESAAQEKTSYCMIASDIIANFDKGFRFLVQED